VWGIPQRENFIIVKGFKMNRFKIICGCCGAALTVQALLHRDFRHTHAEYPDSPASSFVTTMSASGMAIPLITSIGNTQIMDAADIVATKGAAPPCYPWNMPLLSPPGDLNADPPPKPILG
jgi:hypothetical protein